MRFTPVYRCRLCGKTFKTTPTDSVEAAQQVMQALACGLVCTIQDAPRMLTSHGCTGVEPGSMGLAEFLGLELEGDA